jgi:hypothetical protein
VPPTIHTQVVYKVNPKEERIVTDVMPFQEEVDVYVIKEKALAAIDQMRHGTVRAIYITVLPQKPKR